MKEENVIAGEISPEDQTKVQRAEANELVSERENTKEQGKADARLGKFKSVDALMHAYSELEAEFTRRCQRLKAYEEREKAEKEEKEHSAPAAAFQTATPEAGEDGTASESVEAIASEASEVARAKAENADASDALYRAVMQDEGVRARVLSEYFSTLKGVPLLSSAGTGVSAPKYRPKSIAEAGDLALGYFRSEKR